MPHYPKPFFRQSRQLWYVQLCGKQINLGPDREAAVQQYHQLMAQPKQELPPPKSDSPYVAAIADEFLDWVSRRRAAATYDWYRQRLQGFVKKYPKLTVHELKPFHVEKWADGKQLAVTTRRNLLRSVKRCFTWAERQGYVDKNPVANLEIPGGQSREVYVSHDEFAELLTFVRGQSFADLLVVAYETGCRPQELLRVEARHVDLLRCRWVFPPTEAKVKSGPRVVYLSQSACEISERLMTVYAEGPLFRNSRGSPWTKDSVGCSFDRLQVRMGLARMQAVGKDVTIDAVNKLIPALKQYRTVAGVNDPKSAADLRAEAKRKLRQRMSRQFAKRHSLYSLRHSFATNALQRGLDSLTVAVLMGHKDPSQLARTYQHLSLNPGHLLAEARRACG